MILYSDFLQQITDLQSKSLPFVAFKYPNSEELHCVWQNDNSLYPLHFSDKGFAFSSFLGDKSFLLRAENYCISLFKNNTKKKKKTTEISFNLDKIFYKKLINKTISEIKNGSFKKVVISRKIDISVKTEKLSVYFERLIKTYSTAFCYVFFHPNIGCWLAATPETLLKINNLEINTMALAGTKLKENTLLPVWTEKEIEEQNIVTKTIVKELKPFVKKIHIFPTENVLAGNLWHICTNIKAEISDFSQIENIVKKIHPTPAVCGFPTDKTREFIVKNEGYQRNFYSGFCGSVNIHSEKEIQLFVNLRCMQLTENKVFIFVGGGITKNSNPENEWQETQNKAQTMLQILY